MQAESYMLLHRMFGAATTNDDLEITLRQFQMIVAANKDSNNRSDLFDAAWAMSCVADLYSRLHEPFLAERTYLESIKLFDRNDMAVHSATLSVALAKFLLEQGRTADAEAQLKNNIGYVAKYWGVSNRHVLSAKEELRHFQLTREIIEAFQHRWCKACNVDEYGVGFDAEGR